MTAVEDPAALAADSFQSEVFLAPHALLNNPQVTKVLANLKPVRPGLGEIVQGSSAVMSPTSGPS
jgi:hypothetical protein